MSDIPRYMIIHEATIYLLVERVNEAMELGYVPVGVVWQYPWGIGTTRFAQTMFLPVVPVIEVLEEKERGK